MRGITTEKLFNIFKKNRIIKEIVDYYCREKV